MSKTVKNKQRKLTAVESASRSLEGIDNVESSDSLPLRVLSVCYRVTDNILEEGLENTTSLLVDQARDTLDTSTTRQTTNSGLGNALDVVTKNLAMALGSTLSETLCTR